MLLPLHLATSATDLTPRRLQQAAVSLVSATHATRVRFTMKMTNVLHWTRTKTSAPLGTNPRNRIQRGPLVYLVNVFLTPWLQQTNVIVVRHTPIYVHSTIGPHLHTPKQKYVSTSRHSTKIRTVLLGANDPEAASPNHTIQQPNIIGDTSPRL